MGSLGTRYEGGAGVQGWGRGRGERGEEHGLALQSLCGLESFHSEGFPTLTSPTTFLAALSLLAGDCRSLLSADAILVGRTSQLSGLPVRMLGH